MHSGFQVDIAPSTHAPADPWTAAYPSPPDLTFNYFKLLKSALDNGAPVARAPSLRKRVAVVGAGTAGLSAARELWRSGYEVVIFEASGRIGGRLYSVPSGYGAAFYEMGAMRMPFFNPQPADGSKPDPRTSQNCLLSYYLNVDQKRPNYNDATYAVMNDFPNPGKAAGVTGIYMNNGAGPNDIYAQPRLINWVANDAPDNPDLQNLSKKVDSFINIFQTGVERNFGKSGIWQDKWRKISANYDKMTFADLVFTPAVTANDTQNDTYFGGFGMNDFESSLFYTIGAGDGSWGAFYAIGAMWFLRCVMFGFNTNLQSVYGLANSSRLPFYNVAVNDSAGSRLADKPLFGGIQSLCELLLYLQPPGSSRSLYEACTDANDASASLYVGNAVTQIERLSGGSGQIRVNAERPIRFKGGQSDLFDHVVMATPIWATQMSITFKGFDNSTSLPSAALTAMAEQHIIASCKVFLPLKTQYWNDYSNLNDVPGNSIPQIIVTDTFLQDAYGVKWGNNANDAALLASYTWEDDALKVLASTATDAAKNDFAAKVEAKLDDILSQTRDGSNISNYIDKSRPSVVFQWSLQPTYRGCAKLYRERSQEQNFDLLAYNQTYSSTSNVYFAGENMSTEGGWTEPALRTAMDAVIHLVNNSGGSFLNGFSFDTYPCYDTGRPGESIAAAAE